MIELTIKTLIESATNSQYTVQPGVLKQGSKYPAITYTVLSQPAPERTSTRQSHTTKTTTMQIDIWSKSYMQAGQIAEMIKTIDGGHVGDVSLIEVDDVRPNFDNPSELHNRSIDLTITHS